MTQKQMRTHALTSTSSLYYTLPRPLPSPLAATITAPFLRSIVSTPEFVTVGDPPLGALGDPCLGRSYRRQHDVAEKKVAHITSDAGRKAAEAKRDAYKKKLEQATALYNNADRGVKAELKRLAHQRRWKSRPQWKSQIVNSFVRIQCVTRNNYTEKGKVSH